VAIEDVPDEALAGRREELAGDARTRDDVEAHMKRWLKEVVLLEQPFRDTNLTVRDLVTNAVATIGENIRVRRFIRYALGEEL
jgi:elongation factor Ts